MKPMLRNGAYVRLKVAPNTRMGTISDMKSEAGKLRFIFHHDPRFMDAIHDVYVFDYDIEECERPTDAQVRAVNEMIQRGS